MITLRDFPAYLLAHSPVGLRLRVLVYVPKLGLIPLYIVRDLKLFAAKSKALAVVME